MSCMPPSRLARAADVHGSPPLAALQAIQFSTADRFKIVGSYFSELAAWARTCRVPAPRVQPGCRGQQRTILDKCMPLTMCLAIPRCRHHGQRQRQLCLKSRPRSHFLGLHSLQRWHSCQLEYPVLFQVGTLRQGLQPVRRPMLLAQLQIAHAPGVVPMCPPSGCAVCPTPPPKLATVPPAVNCR